MSSVVKVILWGEEIGRLLWDHKRRTSYFTYNPAFLRKGIQVSPLAAPCDETNAMMPVWGETHPLYRKLPAFLADSLPDAWGNQLFECWRKEHKLPLARITPLDRLSFIGKRGMGALEFEPEFFRKESSQKVEIQALADLADRILKEREKVRITPDDTLTMQSLITVGTSAGGRQPKALIAIHRKTGEIRSGQICDLKEYDYSLLKFGQEQYCSAELEMTYYELATMTGIKMMPSRLLEVEGKRHFITERFDRKDGEKLHTQTLAAMAPEADSYEQLMLVCRKLHLSEPEYEEVFRRMVFNHLFNNTDDHNKNFSFVMNRQGQWSLAPAYDMTYIIDTGGYLPNREHCLFLRGKLSDVTLEDVMDFARENGIRRAKTIVNNMVSTARQFRLVAERNYVRSEWIGRVETFLSQKLSEWGFENNMTPKAINFNLKDGLRAENVRLEQAPKGNLHLIATIDGKERKYIIRKRTSRYNELTEKGLSNIKEPELKKLVRELFF